MQTMTRRTGQLTGFLGPLALFAGAGVLLAVLLAPALAQDRALDAERAAGIVGDTAQGYLAVVEPPARAALEREIEEINLKRRQTYREIAAERGTSLAAVEAVFGQTLFERTPSGEFFRKADGTWIKKP
jgi:hypothetical protein